MPLLRLDRLRAFLPPRFSAAALTLLCLTALDVSAHAGHWVLTTTGSGRVATNGTANVSNFVPPTSPSINSVTIPGISSGDGIGPTFGGVVPNTISATANLTIKVAAVWTPDSNSDNTTPPNVILSETSTARGDQSSAGGPVQAGMADDGFGDPLGPGGYPVGTSTTAGAKYVSKSGGTVTATLTLSASGKGTTSFYVGGASAGASVGPITIAIHAQPYNWHDAGYNPSIIASSPDTTPGGYADYTNYQLIFRYKWSSTDGSLADLSGIDIFEYVDYTGNPGTFGTDSSGPYYRPSSPPIAPDPAIGNGTQPYELGNPEISHAVSTTGTTYDIHSTWPTQKQANGKYLPLPVSASQKYKFKDPATGETGTVLYDAGNIQEGVSLNPNQFYIKKSGAHVEKPLP